MKILFFICLLYAAPSMASEPNFNSIHAEMMEWCQQDYEAGCNAGKTSYCPSVEQHKKITPTHASYIYLLSMCEMHLVGVAREARKATSTDKGAQPKASIAPAQAKVTFPIKCEDVKALVTNKNPAEVLQILEKPDQVIANTTWLYNKKVIETVTGRVGVLKIEFYEEKVFSADCSAF